MILSPLHVFYLYLSKIILMALILSILLLVTVSCINPKHFWMWEWPMMMAHDAGTAYLEDWHAIAKT